MLFDRKQSAEFKRLIERGVSPVEAYRRVFHPEAPVENFDAYLASKGLVYDEVHGVGLLGALAEGEGLEDLDFGEALDWLKAGDRVARASWIGSNKWISLCTHVEGTQLEVPFIYVNEPQGTATPWVPTQLDMLMTDWRVL